MRKSVVLFVSLAAVACTIDVRQLEPVSAVQQEITITASSGEPDTRTERAADGAVLWSPGDQISLFYGSGSAGGSCFTSHNTETASIAQFTGTIGVITGGSEVELEDKYFWAVYPYNATASCDGTAITTVLPANQVATADTFADDLFPTMGRSRGLSMAFYNICGGIKFTLSQDGITSVSLKGNSGEQIAGTITVGLDENNLPKVTAIADGSDTITLTAPEGQTFQVGKAYYFVLVPTVFEKGFTMTFSKGEEKGVYNHTGRTVVKRSVFSFKDSIDNQTVISDKIQFEDAIFKAYCVENFDSDGDGEISFTEAGSVTKIDCSNKNISSLEGIQFFSSLSTLWCSSNQLSRLDVSKNRRIWYLSCSSNMLSSIDVSNHTSMEILECSSNQLTSINVSGCSSLYKFVCNSNQLTDLDVRSNESLRQLECMSNQITSLDVSNNAELTNLWCSSNLLTALDASNHTALEYLSCSSNRLASLIVNGCSALTDLYCNSNQLPNLDVSECLMLSNLYCNSNKLATLDVSDKAALRYLTCNSNLLTTLNLSGCSKLSSLECESNQLTVLDASSSTVISYLLCRSNPYLTEIWLKTGSHCYPQYDYDIATVKYKN